MSELELWLADAAEAASPVLVRRPRLIDRTDPAHWSDHGACRTADPAVFFPDLNEPYPVEVLDAARRYCDHCPVHAQCHEHAVEHETEGIWAATTPRQRRRIRIAFGRPEPRGWQTVEDPATDDLIDSLDDGRPAELIAELAGVSTRTVVRRRTARRSTTP